METRSKESKAAGRSWEAEAEYWKSFIPFYGIYCAIKHRDLESQIHVTSQQIGRISNNLDQLHTASTRLEALETYVNNCSDVSSAVSDGWESFHNNISELMQHISSISPNDAGIAVKIQLGAANKECENILKLAGQLNWFVVVNSKNCSQ